MAKVANCDQSGFGVICKEFNGNLKEVVLPKKEKVKIKVQAKEGGRSTMDKYAISFIFFGCYFVIVGSYVILREIWT